MGDAQFQKSDQHRPDDSRGEGLIVNGAKNPTVIAAARQGRSAAAATLLAGAMLLACVGAASASELIYRPTNPSFGGDPFNSSHLFGLAERQNQFLDDGRAADPFGDTSQAEAFIRNLESRLLSSLAQEVDEAIFGEDPQESGTIIFGDTTVTFDRGLEFIDLVITDPQGTTEIQIPVLQTE